MSEEIQNKIKNLKAEIFDLMVAQDERRQQINILENEKNKRLQEMEKLKLKLDYEKNKASQPIEENKNGL